MKEFFIGHLGEIIGILLIVVLLSTTKYWLTTKYEDPIVTYLGVCAALGSIGLWGKIVDWFLK